MFALNFSAVDPGVGKLEASFLNLVNSNAVAFIQKYYDYLSTYKKMDYYAKFIEESRSASNTLTSLILLCRGANQKFLMIIDEYDNFANTTYRPWVKTPITSLRGGQVFSAHFLMS